MKTIKEYVDELLYDRNKLVAFLKTKNIECDVNDSFNKLIPKLKQIKGGHKFILNKGMISFSGCPYDYDIIEQIYANIAIMTNYTTLSYLFYDCPNLTKIPLYIFDTSTVTQMSYLTEDTKTDPVILDAHGCDLSLVKYDPEISYAMSHHANFSKVIMDNTKLCKGSATLFISGRALANSPTLVDMSLENVTYDDAEAYNILGSYDHSGGAGETPSARKFRLIGNPTITFTKPLTKFRSCISGIQEGESVQLNNVSFEDGCEFYGSFNSNVSLKYLPIDLSLLEGKSVNNLSMYGNPALESDIIFPECSITYKSAYSGRFNNLKRVRIFDMSNVTIATTYTSQQPWDGTFSYMGSDLTTEELEGAYFKYPKNMFTDAAIGALNNTFYRNKLLSGELYIDDFKFTWSGRTPSGSTGYNCLYNTFVDTNLTDVHFHITAAYDTKLQITSVFSGDALKNVKFIIDPIDTITNFSCSGLCDGANLETVDLDFGGFEVTVPLNSTSSSKHYSNLRSYKISNAKIKSWPLVNSSSSENNYPILENLEEVVFDNIEILATSVYAFLWHGKFTSLDVSTIDCSVVKFSNEMFKFCRNLTNLKFFRNIGKAYANTSSTYVGLGTCTSLTHESLMDVLNKVYDLNIAYGVYDEEGNPGTGTLKPHRLVLGSVNKAKLTPEEIAIATNKGWTVS